MKIASCNFEQVAEIFNRMLAREPKGRQELLQVQRSKLDRPISRRRLPF